MNSFVNNPILAKSSGETLVQHVESCLSIYQTIKNYFSYLKEISGIEEFFDYLFLTIFFHDFGKFATGFQELLKIDSKWNYRHEILSASILFQYLKTIFGENLNKLLEIAIITVYTSHKDIEYIKANYRTSDPRKIGFNRFQQNFEQLKQNQIEINSLIQKMPKYYYNFNSTSFPFSSKGFKLTFNEIADPYILLKTLEFQNFNQELIFSLLLRGSALTCDYLASAGYTEINFFNENFEDKFPFKKNFIQEKISKIKGDTFLFAPTASGKTEAALFWAFNQLKENKKPRIFFVLPFTASINAMYQRMNTYFPDRVGVLHNKASFFFYRLFMESYEDNESNKESNINQKIKSQNLARQKIQLSKKFLLPLKILTPYQIIKHFFSTKGFEIGITEMANGLFIFDEIHLYNPRTLALIMVCISFLKKYFKAQFLIMTATLPDFLREKFTSILSNSSAIPCISPPDSQMKKEIRHIVNILEGTILDEENISLIEKQIQSKKSVLIVCNNISTTKKIYSRLKNDLFQKNIRKIGLIHGQLILKDRIKIEKEISNLQVLVGTQVIEVSLDIDFQVLFTEPAPIDALIQRFGRINRKGQRDPENVFIMTKTCIQNSQVYPLQRIKKTLSCLSNGPLSNLISRQLILKVYEDGYNEEEQKIYDSTYKMFHSYILKYLKPFHSLVEDKKFEQLFDTIEVLPQQFENEFKNSIDQNQIFDAIQFLVPIRKEVFFRQLKFGNVKYIYSVPILKKVYLEGIGFSEQL